MFSFSSGFPKKVGQIIAAGVVILGSFQLGSSSYLARISNGDQSRPAVKDLSSNIKKSVGQDLVLVANKDSIRVKKDIVESWTEYYTRTYSSADDIKINSDKVRSYLESVAPGININPVDAKLVLKDGKADEFTPPVKGQQLDIDRSTSDIISGLVAGRPVVNLTINTIEPDITLEKVNQLGIQTLLGKGESNFAGSTRSRAKNIQIGAVKFNGIIVAPGQEFSFDSTLGKVDDKAGYEPELVIKNGATIPEYGGGLCQVSTTLFRAAIYAGLRITERKPHSFPVHYYNPQGFDATIYPGVSDLKFVNNTPGHILIQSKITDTKLTFEIYGSDDGRKVTLDGPHQYDQKSNGSMKAYFVRTITQKDGSSKDERFDSVYSPPFAAVRNPLE